MITENVFLKSDGKFANLEMISKTVACTYMHTN